MKTRLLYVLFLAVAFAFCKNEAPPTTEDPPVSFEESLQLPLKVDLRSRIAELDLTAETIEVRYDEFFEESKSYEGYRLLDILKKELNVIVDTTNITLTFICSDGYEPTMRLSKVLTKTPYLAYRDLAANGNWADSIAEKFEPYYLVWDDVEKGDLSYSTPYGLTAIKVSRFDAEFADVYPEARQHQEGFEIFKVKCMKCHAVNKVGGSLGPELNEPKSITDYWTKGDIYNFAKNPQSYRYNSTMPPVPDLTEADFDKIYGYLRYLAGQ